MVMRRMTMGVKNDPKTAPEPVMGDHRGTRGKIRTALSRRTLPSDVLAAIDHQFGPR